MNSWVGKLVTWEKLEGKPNPRMVETKGFGSLVRLIVNRSMFIVGDYGVVTSAVFSADETDEGLRVVTNNSVYLLKDFNK